MNLKNIKKKKIRKNKARKIKTRKIKKKESGKMSEESGYIKYGHLGEYHGKIGEKTGKDNGSIFSSRNNFGIQRL